MNGTDRSIYRRLHGADDLVYEQLTVGETDLHIATRAPCRRVALESVLEARAQLTRYIAQCPEFRTSLTPLEARADAPPLAALMCAVARKAGVGPMAAVAGAIAQYVGEAVAAMADDVIVENGGDLYINSTMERRVAVYAGASPLSGKLALTLPPGRWGVATSAGTFGHSLSFGRADAALIVSHDAALADAAASALGNRLQMAADLECALEWTLTIRGVTGAVGIIDGALGVKGDITLSRA